MSFLMCNYLPSLINELHKTLWFHSLPCKWLTVKTYTHTGHVGVTVPLLILLSVSRHQTCLFPVLFCTTLTHTTQSSSQTVCHSNTVTVTVSNGRIRLTYVTYMMAKHPLKK